MPIATKRSGEGVTMGQARQKSPAVLIVEDDAEVRSLAATLFEDEHLDIIECESAEAALAIMLIGGSQDRVRFLDVRLPGPVPSTLVPRDPRSGETTRPPARRLTPRRTRPESAR